MHDCDNFVVLFPDSNAQSKEPPRTPRKQILEPKSDQNCPPSLNDLAQNAVAEKAAAKKSRSRPKVNDNADDDNSKQVNKQYLRCPICRLYGDKVPGTDVYCELKSHLRARHKMQRQEVVEELVNSAERVPKPPAARPQRKNARKARPCPLCPERVQNVPRHLRAPMAHGITLEDAVRRLSEEGRRRRISVELRSSPSQFIIKRLREEAEACGHTTLVCSLCSRQLPGATFVLKHFEKKHKIDPAYAAIEMRQAFDACVTESQLPARSAARSETDLASSSTSSKSADNLDIQRLTEDFETYLASSYGGCDPNDENKSSLNNKKQECRRLRESITYLMEKSGDKTLSCLQELLSIGERGHFITHLSKDKWVKIKSHPDGGKRRGLKPSSVLFYLKTLKRFMEFVVYDSVRKKQYQFTDRPETIKASLDKLTTVWKKLAVADQNKTKASLQAGDMISTHVAECFRESNLMNEDLDRRITEYAQVPGPKRLSGPRERHKEAVHIRSCLMMAILFANIRRASDPVNMELKEFEEAKFHALENIYQVQIALHKTRKAHGPITVFLSPALYRQIGDFIDLVRPAFAVGSRATNPYVFIERPRTDQTVPEDDLEPLNIDLKPMEESAACKAYSRVWDLFRASSDAAQFPSHEIPKFTSTAWRIRMETFLRTGQDAGKCVTAEEEKQMAALQGHSVDQARRSYNYSGDILERKKGYQLAVKLTTTAPKHQDQDTNSEEEDDDVTVNSKALVPVTSKVPTSYSLSLSLC